MGKNVRDDGIVLTSLERVSRAFHEAQKKSQLAPGDVVVVRIGKSGTAAVVPPELGDANCAGLVVIKAPLKVNARYLVRFLNSPEGQRQAQREARGSTRETLNTRSVEATLVPVPPVSEQRRIADLLDRADAIRRKRREAIALTEELLRSTFLEMFGDPVANPKAWPPYLLQDLAAQVVDCPHSTPAYAAGVTPYPCIRTSDLQAGFLERSTTKYVGEVEYRRRTERLTPRKGDVLYSREGERFGIAALVDGSHQLCLGQRMMIFRPNTEICSPEFLWGLLNSGAVYSQARGAAGGSTSPHVNVGDIRQFRVYLPSRDRQRAFSRIVATASECRTRMFEGLAASEQLFETIANRVFGREHKDTISSAAEEPQELIGRKGVA